MRLTSHNDILTADAPRARHHEPIIPERAVAALIERGYRPQVARAVAHGDLASSTRTRQLAREAGLIAVDTSAAREKGLLR